LARKLKKLFRGKWFSGKIDSFDADALTGEQTWNVLHDDGDLQDFNSGELKRVLIKSDFLAVPIRWSRRRRGRKGWREGKGKRPSTILPKQPLEHAFLPAKACIFS
jgi:hypothetical protein